ncbi:MAG: hypothetical protein OXT64_14710, partial [Gammaproteobacteria bacterium]|nr:hypothetical protein [Gammaproteobacteria bacterium]
MREHRHQGDRHQQGRGQRHEESPHRYLQLLLHAGHAGFDLDEHQRQENDCGCKTRCGDGTYGAPEPPANGGIRCRTMVEGALHRLEHDHAVVHEQPYGERQAEQCQ